jgi:hypothetical protein
MAIDYFDLYDDTTWGVFNNSDSRPMGLGVLGLNSLIFKRKFRWTLAIQYCLGEQSSIKSVAEQFVKTASRPKIDFDETEINYLNGKFFIPGKGTIQEMNVTYYDVAGIIEPVVTCSGEAASDPNQIPGNINTDCSCDDYLAAGVDGLPKIGSVFGWIASVYDITDSCQLSMGSRQGDYSGTGLLRLYDGCGQTIEAWLLNQLWPKNVDFGELDMSNSETCDINLTLRYQSFDYRQLCPAATVEKCPCIPCDA